MARVQHQRHHQRPQGRLGRRRHMWGKGSHDRARRLHRLLQRDEGEVEEAPVALRGESRPLLLPCNLHLIPFGRVVLGLPLHRRGRRARREQGLGQPALVLGDDVGDVADDGWDEAQDALTQPLHHEPVALHGRTAPGHLHLAPIPRLHPLRHPPRHLRLPALAHPTQQPCHDAPHPLPHLRLLLVHQRHEEGEPQQLRRLVQRHLREGAPPPTPAWPPPPGGLPPRRSRGSAPGTSGAVACAWRPSG